MEASPPSLQFRVTVFPNGCIYQGTVIWVNKEKDFEHFLDCCAKKVKVKPPLKIYNKDGAEIVSLEDIIPNEVLYVAMKAETFLRPSGGTLFTTTRSTLQTEPDSMLAKMFGEEWGSKRDANGHYLIDRSPEYFAPLLTYLRNGQLILDDDVNVEGVYEEAKFFNLVNILDDLKSIMEKRSRSKHSLTRKELVSILLTSSINSSLRCQGLNLSYVDLSKLDLSHINFRMTDFTGANLERTNLDNAMLQEAIFQGANLQYASLRGANLGGANLEGANLKGANFEDRGGVKANLEGAKLKGCSLEDCNFSGANLRAANLRKCNLENANLRSADLAGADLEGVNLRGANLNKSNLIGANLHDANFDIRTTTPWG